jgi:hypothetical protein
MELPEQPFKAADRFIVLRDICIPHTFTAQFQRINDMIIMPLIALLLFFTAGDLWMLISSGMTAFKAWKEWIEFTELSFTMQRKRLRMAQVKGPFIATNNDKYMPYVWADAVVRHQKPRL